MVNGKRVIGIFVGKADSEGNLNYFRELYNLAQENDYITIIYSLLADLDETGQKTVFDKSMLHVVNFDYVDAVLVIKDDFLPVSFVDEVIAYAKKNNKPRAVIGLHHEDAFSIEFQGNDSYETIVRHIVEEHNCKNVYFLGDKGNEDVANMCLGVYQKVLDDNEIPYVSSHVALVNNWDNSVDRIITDWVSSSERPDAIVCSTDYVAMLACRALVDNGYLVPENVLVAGYGYEERNRVYYPKLTTTHKDQHTISEILMELFGENFSSGFFNNMVIKQQLQVCYAQSCGCEKSSMDGFSKIASSFSDRINNMETQLSRMFELTGKASEIDDYAELTELFSDYLDNQSYIVLRNSVWATDGSENDFPDYEDSVTVIRSNANPLTDQKRVFPLGIYDANMDTIDQDDCIRAVHLLSFKNIVYGYYVVRSVGKMKGVTKHLRFSDISRIILNGVYSRRKLKVASEQVKELQTRDSLTGVYNFKGFERRVQESYLANKDGRKLIVFAFDIEGFKDINEQYGHSEGDNALVALADIIRASANGEDVCARIGADEYILAMATSEDQEYIIYNYMNSFYQSLNNYNSIYEKNYELKICVDHCVGAPESVEQVDALVKDAVAKKNSKKLTEKTVNDSAMSEQDAEDYESLKKLINTNSFDYMLQPIISAYTGEIYGYEALMRTVNDIHLSPIRILEIAEKYGRLQDIERATVRNVYEKVSINQDKIKGRKVFINSIVGYGLQKEEAEAVIGQYVDVAGDMVVEITEQNDITDEEYISYVSGLKNAGLQIAIDDFGTGYSNTSRLIEYTPNYVKIDRSLINGINSDYRKQHFVNNIIEYAHENGFMALAEGVETALELRCVIKMGVDLIQGYYTARPSFEIADRIDDAIMRDIVNSSVKRLFPEDTEKTFVVNGQSVVYLSDLRSDDYKQIYISKEDVTIIGDDESTWLNINIGDNYQGTVTIKDLQAKSNHGTPVIEIGENSDAHLVFEGENFLWGGGIFVAESSRVEITGGGTLKIESEAPKVVGIGGLPDTAYGTIDIDLPGGIEMIFAADTAIAIGGAYNPNGRSIVIKNTPINLHPAVANLLGIGTIFDPAKIYISDSSIDIKTGVRLFVGIGSVRSNPDVSIVRSKLNFVVGGNSIWAIGSFGEATDPIYIVDSELTFEIQGKSVIGVGAESGSTAITISGCKLNGMIEGATVLFVGVRTKEGSISMTANEIDVRMNSENLVEYAVENRNFVLM